MHALIMPISCLSFLLLIQKQRRSFTIKQNLAENCRFLMRHIPDKHRAKNKARNHVCGYGLLLLSLLWVWNFIYVYMENIAYQVYEKNFIYIFKLEKVFLFKCFILKVYRMFITIQAIDVSVDVYVWWKILNSIKINFSTYTEL